jgi:probable FeS assembly SUF system protein SufT
MSNMVQGNSLVLLTRDVMASMVPSGARILLHAGTEVSITQELGNSVTVNVYGNLARIDHKDADSLGREVAAELLDIPSSLSAKDRVWHQLSRVYDPEIPVNIVDLGLIYRVALDELSSSSSIVTITMTLTAPGCGMGPVIVEDVKYSVLALPEVSDVEVDLVFDPPWSKSMMSDMAQLELGVL